MVNSNPNLKATKPVSIFQKPLEVDFKELLKALGKGIAHGAVGKWDEIASDAVDAFAALGLTTEPEALAFLLINRAITRAVFDLVGESANQHLLTEEEQVQKLSEKLDTIFTHEDIYLDKNFLDRPSELAVVRHLQAILQIWLEGHGIALPAATAIVKRLPSYFVYALNQEWRNNAKNYVPLDDALNTPFTKASDREWAWASYSALLQRRIHEGIFDESFSLSQIFIPLNAYYQEMVDEGLRDEMSRASQQRRRKVVPLREELEQWIEKSNPEDSIRVVSGGPGSGKSSFARIFAAQTAQNGRLKVLFVPLHLVDPDKDLVEEIGRFVRDEGVLVQNPLDPQSPEPNLLIIFDGLDELASQGKAAAEAARAFVREVDRTVARRNLQSMKLRVLISGRELVVQENESEFRRPRQVLTLLPYYVPKSDRENKEYDDANKLLEKDLRQDWWKNYGVVSGKGYQGLPIELSREDLEEITAQPLLNYLVALSFTREKLDFTKDINLNSVYADLVAAVHERGYEKHRPFVPIRHMLLSDFERVLEEIGLAAWHGDGRTTTIREIEEHCRVSGVGVLLDAFQEGASAGVTRLLAAFFFRRYGQRASGDPTFVFTHKSFGEYLAARRIVRAISRVCRELEDRKKDPDKGWDDRHALEHWIQICGPSAISPYLHVFLQNEIKLRTIEEITRWQGSLSRLFSYMLRHGTPMELFQIATFRESMFQARNAEEALLAALHACAFVTHKISSIEHPDPAAFGAWFKRIQGQRTGRESALVARCLSFLELSNICFPLADFFDTTMVAAQLMGTWAEGTNFMETNLAKANLSGANFTKTYLENANLEGANLEDAILQGANLENAHLEGANLNHARLQGANLKHANLERAVLTDANLKDAVLESANLKHANLENAILLDANLEDAVLESANLNNANLVHANLIDANLIGVNLVDADLTDANLEGAQR